MRMPDNSRHLRPSPQDPVAVHVVLDGAHTPGSAAALSETVRGFFPDAPVAVVLAMAADKDAEGVCGALRAMAPMAVMFAGGLRVGGSDARAAAPGALVAAWQRAEVEARRRGQGRMVCREQVGGWGGSSMCYVHTSRVPMHAIAS